MKCQSCRRSDKDIPVYKCPSCHKDICDRCVHSKGNKCPLCGFDLEKWDPEFGFLP